MNKEENMKIIQFENPNKANELTDSDLKNLFMGIIKIVKKSTEENINRKNIVDKKILMQKMKVITNKNKEQMIKINELNDENIKLKAKLDELFKQLEKLSSN